MTTTGIRLCPASGPKTSWPNRINHVFEAAKDNAPSVIFIEDADAIFEDGEERGPYRYLLTSQGRPGEQGTLRRRGSPGDDATQITLQRIYAIVRDEPHLLG